MLQGNGVGKMNQKKVCQLETLNGHPWKVVSLNTMPPENREIHAEAVDHLGPYRLPFSVIRRGDRFFHAEKGNEIKVAIKKWRLA